MRTISPAQAAILSSTARSSHVRVQIENQAGGFWDVSTELAGYDFLDSVTLSDDVDAPLATASVTLKRQVFELSLATLHEDSRFNREAQLATNTYEPLIVPGRRVKISAATLPADSAPTSGDWSLWFDGYIDDVDWADEVVRLSCSDLAAQIRDTFIEEERGYGLKTGSAGLRIYQPGTAYALGELVLPRERDGNIYEVTTAGTSGTNYDFEPAWNTTDPVISGTVEFEDVDAEDTSAPVETVMQQILNDNGLSAFVLYTPTSPSWEIRPYAQDRRSVLDALRDLASQIGWDVRMKWRDATSQFELTLFEPDRAKTAADHTFMASDVRRVNRAAIRSSNIRNVIRVVYSDTADRTSAGDPKRKTYEATDATSISNYGRRFMEIAESSSSQIDTAAEAQTLAENVVADLSTPIVELGAEVPLFWFCEIGDLYEFPADGVHFTSDQKLAVISASHSFSGDRATSTFELRGKPAGGFERWGDRAVDPKAGKGAHRLTPLEAPITKTVFNTIPGAALLHVTQERAKGSLFDGFEFHQMDYADTTEGEFTTSESTFKSIVKGDGLVMTGKPGRRIAFKAIPVGSNPPKPVRGGAGPSGDGYIGYARPQHSHPSMFWRTPLNGDFTSGWPGGEDISSDDYGNEPDHWGPNSSETWAIDYRNDSTCLSGTRSIEFPSTSTAANKIKSGKFPVVEGESYKLIAYYRNSSTSGSNRAYLALAYYDRTGAFISASSESITAAAADTWTKHTVTKVVPSTARFAEVVIGKADTGAFTLRWDSVEVERLTLEAADVGAAAGGDGWQTAFDIDFSGLADQSLSSNTNYTLDGVTFTRINAANGNIDVDNGAGLVFSSIASSTDLIGSTRTLPALYASLASVIPDFSANMPLRLWLYVSAENFGGNYDAVKYGFESGAYQFLAQRGYSGGDANGFLQTPYGAGSTYALSNSAPYSTDDMLLLEAPNGISGGLFPVLSGAHSGGWASAAMNPCAVMSQPASFATGGGLVPLPASSWNIIFGVQRAASGTTGLSVTIQKVKLEYKT